MKEYIEREMAMKAVTAFFEPVDTVDKAVILNHLLKKLMLPLAADVVSKAAFDQVMWERDVAIQQLRDDYGVGLGEKKAADVVERKRGKWEFVEQRFYHGGFMNLFRCSECRSATDREHNFCPNCGADMREENHE